MESSKLGSGILVSIKPSKRIVQTKRLSYSNRGVERRKSLVKSSGGLEVAKNVSYVF
jgi:hypothetical protein